MKCSDCIYYNKNEYCERYNDRVYHECNICEYYVRDKMDQEITMNLKLKGNLMVLSDEELDMLWNIVGEAIYDGAYPPKMKRLMSIYDKIEKLFRKE